MTNCLDLGQHPRTKPDRSSSTYPRDKLKSFVVVFGLLNKQKKKIITNQTKPYEFAVEEVEALQRQRLKNMSVMENQKQQDNKGQLKKCERKRTSCYSRINNLDDGCLMHIFSFLSPIPGITFFFNFLCKNLIFLLNSTIPRFLFCQILLLWLVILGFVTWAWFWNCFFLSLLEWIIVFSIYLYFLLFWYKWKH